MEPISVKFCNIKVTPFNREELKEFLIQTLYEKKQFRIILLDERKYFQAIFNRSLREVINKAEIVLCASQTVRWTVRLHTKKQVPIIMPVTLFLDIMRTADEMGYSVFLFGGSSSTNLTTVKRIKKSFPNIRIVGNYQSNIQNEEAEKVLTAIRKSAPQIFIADLSGGKQQEFWLTDNRKMFPNSIVVGVDNAFQIISGKQKMPPIWVQQRELNGLYRTFTQPLNFGRLFRIVVIFFVTLFRRLFKKDL